MRFDREVWRAKLAPLLEQWQYLADKYPALLGLTKNVNVGLARRPITGAGVKKAELDVASVSETIDPITGFVAMEHAIAMAITAEVSSTLAALRKVVYGTALLTPQIQAVATNLMAGNVPIAWAKKWEGPGKPAAWLALLARKAVAITSWQAKAHDGTLLDVELDLNDVFRPLTFLNALRQLAARKTSCPMDALELVSGWSKNSITSPAPIVVKVRTLEYLKIHLFF